MSVAVVTDTTTYLPRALLDRENVHQVSLYLNRGTTTTRESDLSADLDAFYAELAATSDTPKTSQPSPGDFLDVYAPLVEAGHDVVSVHLAAGISGTVEAARVAALEAAPLAGERRIEVVDSESACGGLGMIVLAAAAAANAGRDVDAVLARAVEARAKASIWFAIDTLEYLRRGGRIGRVQSWLGGALSIKPILSVDAEGIRPVERARTQKRAFQRMVDFSNELVAAGKTAYCVQHIQAPAEAERLAGRAREIFGHDPLFISEIGPVIGAHTGPGLLGIGGIAPGMLERV